MVVSEAVPAVVGTPKIGTDGFLVAATPSSESTSANSGLAVTMPMPLQVSCGEPPPRPIRKSAPASANLATPSLMHSTGGFGWTLLKISYGMPASSSTSVTFLTVPVSISTGSVTMNALVKPCALATSGICLIAPRPKYASWLKIMR